MTFKIRNLYYLRVSKSTVIPLYVFLDEQHTKWMTDLILQRVLLDLRPYILSTPTPTVSAKAGKPAICTLQGDEYQLCYFFRNVDDHSVLVKTRFYTAQPTSSMVQGGKRKRKTASRDVPRNPKGPSRESKRKRKKRQSRNLDASDSTVEETMETGHEDSDEVGSPARTVIAETMAEDATTLSDEVEVMDVDIAEEKPKPRMQLKYEGFHIHGQCLCVVVEPLPQKAGEKRPSATVADRTPERNREPLFLPEKEKDLEDDQSSEDGEGGMMAFSQRLSAMGDYSLPADDAEGSEEVFIGDADDSRDY